VVLINKRLERGQFMNLSDLEESEITTDELDQLLRGGVVRRPQFGRMPKPLTALRLEPLDIINAPP
jgi:hypothetical protein